MKIGFIGLGTMGAPMAANIVKKHDDTVYVWNRTQNKTEPLVQAGAFAVSSPQELADKSDIIITMVTASSDSAEVWSSILDRIHPGKIGIDMSTIDPSVSIRLSEHVKKRGGQFLDAPVVKSQPAAVAGTLGIYVGGDASVYQTVEPILRYMGENVIYLGPNGNGLVMKICHNALVSQIQNGVNETVNLAEKNGIDIATFAEAASYGGAQNFYLDSKKEVLEHQDFTPAFSIKNMNKDVQIALNLAQESHADLSAEKVVAEVYRSALEQGYGEEDFSATYKVVRDKKV